jgi:pimeloyl-ACP methyl ester carboxylesterase
MAFSPGWPEKNDGVIQQLKKIQLQNDPQAYLITSKAMIWGSPPPDASHLKMPVLIIAGEHDAWSGIDSAREGQKLITGSKLVTMPTGHASAIERPVEFNKAVLDFLSGLS